MKGYKITNLRVGTGGNGYNAYELGDKSHRDNAPVLITEHKPDSTDAQWYFDITMEDGSVVREYDIISVTRKPTKEQP